MKRGTALLLLALLCGCDSMEKALDPSGSNDPAGYDDGRVSVEERNQQVTVSPEERNELVTVPGK